MMPRLGRVEPAEPIDLGGLGGLSINVREESADGATASFTAMAANSWTYTTLASAINIGLQILETSMGRAVLANLGRSVVEGWAQTGRYVFGGTSAYMEAYVDHYLATTRNDFTLVTVDNIGSLHIIAEARRSPVRRWNGDLNAYRPKLAGGMYFNRRLVSAMTRTADALFAARPHSAEGRRLSVRHKTYQFMFATATAHELTHLFVAYLAQGEPNLMGSFTPPNVSYLNYGTAGTDTEISLGESGRWLESRLFGGSIEYYRECRHYDDHEFGIPHLLDQNAVSWKISFDCVASLVEDPRRFQFPFPVQGNGRTGAQRRQLGMVVLGGSQPAAPQTPSRLLMRARNEPLNFVTYNVPGSDLRQVAIFPRRIRRAQMVAA